MRRGRKSTSQVASSHFACDWASGANFTANCGAWKAVFSVAGKVVTVLALEPGYPLRFLNNPDYEDLPDREAQLACWARWPEQFR